ncbi:MAG TPA: basic amino acid ABC transporter substrate-binding protein [Bacillota bacterium]|nr:basic amino acid ABC transporter substrate-binding protein [Bacillota bacterium]
MKKSLLAVSMALVLVVGVFAETWVVAGDFTFPPFTWDETGKGDYMGYEIDLAKALAEEMGVELKLVNAAWSGLIPGLNNGNYDSLITAMTITEERMQAVDFSTPYISVGLVVVAKQNNNSINSLDDLKGKTVAVQIGTTGDLAATEMNGIKQILRYETAPEAFQAVINGIADASVMDGPVARDFIRQQPKLLKVVVPEFTEELYGVVVKKGNKALLDKINDALKALEEKGVLDKIYNDWFGVSE